MKTSIINPHIGTITVELASLPVEALGEILRAHVFGYDKGYRDMEVTGPYEPIQQEALSPEIVDELLGDPQCREDWMRVTAWTDGTLTIAVSSDGDTSLLFQIRLPGGTRTVVNHDAKKDYGWNELTVPS